MKRPNKLISSIRADLKLFKTYLGIIKAPPILVYQLGKVGSASIYHSLDITYPGLVRHAHEFNEADPNRKNRQFYTKLFKEKESPIKVIALVRNPIDRDLSRFFQDLKQIVGAYKYHTLDISFNELQDKLLQTANQDYVVSWFDNNIKQNFGIDVFSEGFSDSGHQTYNNKNIDLLVMRAEISDNDKENAIKDFLDFKDFKLERYNITADKKT